MSKRVTAQDGKIELIVADGASDIDIGADGTLAGSVNLGARVSVDNNGNIVIQDSTDTYTWTIAPQAGWIDINASDPGNTEYGMYFDTVEIGVYDYAVTAPSQPPIAADGAFESKFNIWSRANPTEYEIAAFGFSGGPDLEIYNGIRGGNINFYAFNDAGAAQSLITLDPDTEQVILPLSNVPASPTLAFGDGDSGLYESTDDSINVAIATLQKYTFNATGFSTASSFGSSLVFGNPTATVPTVVPNKGDADTGLGQAAVDQLSLVAGGVEMLRLSETGVATTDQIIIGPGGNIGSTTNPALALDSTGVTGFSGSSTELHAILNGARQWYFSGVNFRGNGGSSPVLENVTPTSTDPNIIPNRTDLNTGIGWNAEDQLSLIAGGKEMLRLAETGAATTDQVIISPGVVGGSAAATPTLAFGDGDTGFYETLDDILSLSLAGTQTWNFASGSFEGNATDAAALLNSGATATVPTVVPVKTDTNTGIGSAAADQLSLIAGGVEMLRLSETGTATSDQIIISPAGIIGNNTTPALAFGDGDTGLYESADDTLVMSTGTEIALEAVLNAGVTLYWDANERLATLTNGSVALRSDTSADSTRKRLDFEHADGTLRGYVGLNTDNFIYLHNEIDGTGLILTANDAGGSARTFLIGDPDAITTLTGDTELRFVTATVEANRIQAATVQTTDATVTEIISVAVPSGEGFGFEIHIMGTEDATGDTVFERVFGAIRNQGGTTALVGSTITDRTDDAGATTWVVSVEADDAGDALTVDVTGEAAHTIDWKIRVELLNV